MDLITTSDLAKHFGRPIDVVETAAKRAKLESMALGETQLYLKEKALEALTPILRPPVTETPAAPPLTTAALVPLYERLTTFELRVTKSMDAAASESEKRDESMTEVLKKLNEQNVIINRALLALRADTLARLDAMQAVLDALQHPVVEPAPRRPTPAPAEPTKKPRVAIVSLLGSQRALIEREFSEVFDLRIMDSEDQRRGESRVESVTASCDVVVLMTTFTTAGTEKAARASGAKVVKVPGGMSQLRDALTSLLVELSDK